MMPPFEFVFPTNRIAYFVEVSLLFYLAQQVKLVICEEEAPYTEGVLFHNGFELTCTEPGCTYDGEWNFECNGIEYTVFVEVEN